MSDWTEIANKALIFLGEDSVTDVETSNQENATLIRAVRNSVRDAELRAHNWNFAHELASLAALSAAPAFGYSTQYQLPTNPWCLRPWKLEWERHGDAEWKVRGRRIHTDEAAPLQLHYIARVTDAAQFDAVFVDAVSLRLAWWTAMKLTGSRALRTDAREEYARLTADARFLDAIEGTPAPIEADELLDARD